MTTMTSTLKIEETTYNEHGYTYSGYRVAGYLNGKRIRIRCKDKSHAQMVLIREQTKGINAARSLEYLPTHLTKGQLDEAESVIEELGKIATLTEVYEFWRSHHAAAGEQVTIGDAVIRYLNFQEPRIRETTWKQSKQALNKFAEFVGADSPIVEVTHQSVIRYLDSLRGADGVSGDQRRGPAGS